MKALKVVLAVLVAVGVAIMAILVADAKRRY